MLPLPLVDQGSSYKSQNDTACRCRYLAGLRWSGRGSPKTPPTVSRYRDIRVKHHHHDFGVPGSGRRSLHKSGSASTRPCSHTKLNARPDLPHDAIGTPEASHRKINDFMTPGHGPTRGVPSTGCTSATAIGSARPGNASSGRIISVRRWNSTSEIRTMFEHDAPRARNIR